MNLISKQARASSLSVFFILLTACHRYDLAPREIEITSNNPSLSYATRTRYQRALNRLAGAGMIVGPPRAQQLQIQISGKARSLADGKYFPIVPRTVLLKNNHCKIIQMLDHKKTEVTPLQICYINRELYVDPSPDDPVEPYVSSVFYPSALWKIGGPLPGIDTSGLASLRQAELRIRYITRSEAEDDKTAGN